MTLAPVSWLPQLLVLVFARRMRWTNISKSAIKVSRVQNYAHVGSTCCWFDGQLIIIFCVHRVAAKHEHHNINGYFRIVCDLLAVCGGLPSNWLKYIYNLIHFVMWRIFFIIHHSPPIHMYVYAKTCTPNYRALHHAETISAYDEESFYHAVPMLIITGQDLIHSRACANAIPIERQIDAAKLVWWLGRLTVDTKANTSCSNVVS